MRGYSWCNEIKQVFNGNPNPDPWTENKPTTQLLRGTEDGSHPGRGRAGNEMAWGQGRSPLSSAREGRADAGQVSQRSLMDLPLFFFFFLHFLLREKVLFLPTTLGRAEVEKGSLFLKFYIAQ